MYAYITPSATVDLDDIWFTIACDNQKRADNYLADLLKRMSTLAEFPRMGHRVEEIKKDMWVFPLDDYLIFYQITKKGITVARVWHAKRDLTAIFFSEE